jgi:hypothetical protein
MRAPPDKRTGPDATPTPFRAVPAPTPTSTTGSVPHRDDPRRIGELLGAWLDVRMGEVDDLVAEARAKVATLPNERMLWECFGEWLLRLMALEREVAELRKAARR